MHKVDTFNISVQQHPDQGGRVTHGSCRMTDASFEAAKRSGQSLLQSAPADVTISPYHFEEPID